MSKKKSRHCEVYEPDILHWIRKSACVAKWLERTAFDQWNIIWKWWFESRWCRENYHFFLFNGNLRFLSWIMSSIRWSILKIKIVPPYHLQCFTSANNVYFVCDNEILFRWDNHDLGGGKTKLIRQSCLFCFVLFLFVCLFFSFFFYCLRFVVIFVRRLPSPNSHNITIYHSIHVTRIDINGWISQFELEVYSDLNYFDNQNWDSK